MKPTSVKLTFSYDWAEIWQVLEDSGNFVAVERGRVNSLLYLEFLGDPSPEIRRNLVRGVREAWPKMDPTATVGVIDESGVRMKFTHLPEEVILRILQARLALHLQQQLGQ